ncbi:unnamed protein product [Cyprideis torosa]|uniref:Uncharacterized protein n=1 Tax=Cyprideis torosa TaxID=163714 RepID=A0A7R8ZJC3_9CRUS|nr:unnamed protein product [Cyprideis torosa]CAG0879515.1 unnamed protein product [Cyprideis torosa]
MDFVAHGNDPAPSPPHTRISPKHRSRAVEVSFNYHDMSSGRSSALPQSVQDHQKNDRSKRVSGLYTGPYFDPSTPKTITAQAGSSAFLLCKVKQLENKSVSWVRRTDAHILAVNQQIFIRDPRFHIRQAKRDPGLWTLQIRQVKKSDAGDYECQISTEPKRSWLINLKVVVPEVKLIGGPDIFVQRGSGVELRCQVSDASEKRFIFWFKLSLALKAAHWQLNLNAEAHYYDHSSDLTARIATQTSLLGSLLRRQTSLLESTQTSPLGSLRPYFWDHYSME